MSTYPFAQANAASFKAETSFLNAARFAQPQLDGVSIRSRHSSVSHRQSDALERRAALVRSTRPSNASSRNFQFDRSWLTPLTADTRHAHESSALDDEDDDTLSFSGGNPVGGMTARSSFTSAFRSVYGSVNMPIGHHETAPLLAVPETSQIISEALLPPPLPSDTDNPFVVELGVISRYTLPIFGTQLAQYSLTIVSVVFVGHLSTVDLAGASLGSMTANVLAFSIVQGFASALDSLCPMAFSSSQPSLSSLYAQRTAVLVYAMMIPQAILFWKMESVFLALKQPQEVAHRAALYLKIMSAALPAYGGFEIMRKWLQGQGRFFVATCVVLIVAPINCLLAYFLVIGPIDSIRLGFVGAAVSTVISFWLMFLLTATYSTFILPKDAWGGWTREALHSLGTNLKLGIAGVFMICAEWAWEIAALAAAYLGPEALATQSVLGVITSLAYQLPFAISAACAVRVANLIGAGYAKLAKKSSRTGLAIAVVLGLMEGALLSIFKDQIGKLFVSDPYIVSLVATIMPVIALFQVSDAICGIGSGLLRGAGRATVGACINIASYYVIGLPLGFALTFSSLHFGLRGIWLGLTTSLTFTAVFMTVFLLLLDWQAEVGRASKRIAADMTTTPQTHYDYGTIAE